MKRKLLYASFIFSLIIISLCVWRFWPQPKPKPTPIALKQASFAQLPGWSTANVKKSLETFQVSCKTFLRHDPEKPVGSHHLSLTAKDWHPACQAALRISPITNKNAREFFQKWFTPVEFYNNQPVRGLFTGYYMPLLHGSRIKTKKYNVPIYGLPSDLLTIDLSQFDPNFKHKKLVGRLAGRKVVPYYTREEISKGAIKNKASVLVWIDNPVDRVFLEIQGSGIVQLPDGEQLYLGYAAQNGAPYTAIAKVLIDKGVMTKHTASMQAIKRYLMAHPKEMKKVLNQNKSFVFFEILRVNAALGTQGVALTPGYSLAVDLKWIPIGTPLWLSTTRPDQHSDEQKPFQRLMIAQDTGGAIRGLVRGDVFWGAGKRATYIAGHMKNEGHYWLLLPQHATERLTNEFRELAETMEELRK
ncbi:Membrane-bound lytic murein transglycosylase [Legionella lansingensis]|uniref:Membrane-bound lytic murein transglycosylase A n=1 Tax=Legionella lansingensis TaxID=45067 RepID=A0A0W0VPZ4_9GAMM|nr:murein transglycosylase A [Legionella lansingensis]KTD22272.1 Membrane-bound lytic murein transglycosylase [Legionella lansingensis]SNV50607.1 Membrane-bound lytic murein transglycosylase [Legionella lansingensis]